MNKSTQTKSATKKARISNGGKGKSLTLAADTKALTSAITEGIKADVDTLIKDITTLTETYWNTAKWTPTQKALALSRALTFLWAKAQSKIVEGMIFTTTTAGQWTETTNTTTKTPKKFKSKH